MSLVLGLWKKKWGGACENADPPLYLQHPILLQEDCTS